MEAYMMPWEVLIEFSRDVLLAAGSSSRQSETVARGLVCANLRGIDSHGVLRLPQYVDSLKEGEVNATPKVAVRDARSAAVLVDADGGYGFEPSYLAADLACDIAERSGVGIVGVCNSHHFGMAANYGMAMSDRAKIGLILTTSSPVLVYPGSRTSVVGNSPICCAIPRRERPAIVLDMALSTAAFGKIRLAAAEGRSIPPGWALDDEGEPTVDAQAALQSGLLTAIGGHKGHGLAVISAALAGVLTGSPFGSEARGHRRRSGGVGHLLVAIDPTAFVGDAFYDGMERLVGQIKSVDTLEGGQAEPLLPGEPEWRTSLERERDGIPLSVDVLEALELLAMQVGILSLQGPVGPND